MFVDNFSDWVDVRREYHNEGAEYGKYEENSPVPHKVKKVIFAGYSYENYEGSSVVVFYDKNKYWLQESGHCSCYGLEGTWDPVDYPSAKLFIDAVMDRSKYGYLGEHKDKIVEQVKAWEKERSQRKKK